MKDHFIRLVYLRELREKKPSEVANHISHIYGLLGYPLVHHSDNGFEVMGKAVLRAVRELHPECHTAQGKKR